MPERVDTDRSDRALDKSKRSVAVWDPLVRIVHWSLVTGIAVTWLTTEGPSAVHDTVGYAVLALVALRLVWGFVGPEKARFVRFVRTPGATLDYAKRLLHGREPRHVGHNPLGGWMIVALLATAFAAAATGWLYTTDRFWGVKWMEELHGFFAELILVLAALHVLGVIVTSIRHRENLVAAMWTGRKRAPEGDDQS
jgi:cytochrome b